MPPMPQIAIRKLDLQVIHDKASEELSIHYDTLRRCLLPESLRSLSTCVANNDQLAALIDFLRHAGGLTDLELDLTISQADPCLLSEAVVSLKSLSILRLHTSYMALCGEGTFPLAPFFSQPVWRTLEEIHFLFPWDKRSGREAAEKEGREDEDEQDEHAERQEQDESENEEDEAGTSESLTDVYDPILILDRILSNKGRLPALRKVQVTVMVHSLFTRDDPDAEKIVGHLRAMFPETQAKRRILDIQFAPNRDDRPSPLAD